MAKKRKARRKRDPKKVEGISLEVQESKSNAPEIETCELVVDDLRIDRSAETPRSATGGSVIVEGAVKRVAERIRTVTRDAEFLAEEGTEAGLRIPLGPIHLRILKTENARLKAQIAFLVEGAETTREESEALRAENGDLQGQITVLGPIKSRIQLCTDLLFNEVHSVDIGTKPVSGTPQMILRTCTISSAIGLGASFIFEGPLWLRIGLFTLTLALVIVESVITSKHRHNNDPGSHGVNPSH